MFVQDNRSRLANKSMIKMISSSTAISDIRAEYVKQKAAPSVFEPANLRDGFIEW